ncbi:hypothetical protein MNBD_GAMMA12-3888 [hydrothermal vent metagenome]|uniref:FtsH ternary system domain-containing protein n=1 Tax=hydrothermal vent metagenome TaxID=652676 RepID=A0A3B0YPN1_9ZZZZ
MANITIKLIFNKTTGKKDIYIDLQSDSDAMPIEHEQQHRLILEQLLGKGVLQASEAGEIIVTRGQESNEQSSSTQQTQNQNNKLDQGQ